MRAEVFLSSNTQDFIEVESEHSMNLRDLRFLSSNTQDFIEVGSLGRKAPAVAPIPEL